MSLRNILAGIGRKFLKKERPTTTATGQTTGASRQLPPPPETIAEQTAATVAKPPAIQQAFSNAPMEAGNKLFASTLFDRIAQKGPVSLSADDWANWLVNRGKRKVKVFGKEYDEGFISARKFKLDEGFAKGSYLRGKDQTVPLEELFDSNIASFSRSGELTGGLLFSAKQAGVKVAAKDLAEMAAMNPAYRLRPVEYGIPSGVVDAAENTIDLTFRRLRAIEKVIDNAQRSSPSANLEYGMIKESFNALKGSIQQLRDNVRGGNFAEIADAEKNIAVNMKRIKSLARTNDQKLIFNNIQGEIDDVISQTKNIRSTRHGGDTSYTFPGGTNYKEGFLVLDEGIPLNKRARFKNPHFGDDIDVENPVVHFRYDTRTLPNGKKAYLISEIQSDTNQKIAAALRRGGLDPLNTTARTNPFQNDKIISFLSKERARLSRDILDRKVGGKTLEYTANQIKKLDEQLRNVTQRSTLSPAGLGRGSSVREGQRVDYYPLVDRQQYASAAIKYLANKAAKEGVDYVSIAPVNLISRNIDNQTYKGMVQAYGYARGNKTPGSKSLAAYPDVMKAIAKTFDSKTEVIRIAKSDPTKPYKVLEPTKVTVPKDKGYDQIYHTKAYKNKPSADQDNTVYIPADDAKLYTDVFSVKVTPNMAQPQKIYKKLGGFINKNLFRMN